VRTGDGWWLYRAFPLQDTGWLLFSAPRPIARLLTAVVEALLRPVLQAGTVALALSIGLAYVISRSVSAPLRQISDAAKAVAVGDFDHQVQPSGPDEVQSLALAFDKMTRRVKASHQAQRDFVANVSHELKTPLTSIQGFAQALMDGTASDDDARMKAAGIIHEESDRLRRLVDDLLDLARLDAEQVVFMRRPVDLNALIQRVVDGLGVTAKEQGVELAEIASHYDTVSLCLSKGLGAPAGSILVGSAELVVKARRWRKVLGGGLRQSGMLAAAGLYALEHNVARLAEDHANALRLAEGLTQIPGISCEPGSVQTNMVFATIEDPAQAQPLEDYLRANGVLTLGGQVLRLVTHKDVDADGVARAADLVAGFFR
jgi:HAMP domain-containing protein